MKVPFRSPLALFLCGTGAGCVLGGILVWWFVSAERTSPRRAAIPVVTQKTEAGVSSAPSAAGSPGEWVLRALRENGSHEAAVSAALGALPPARWPELFAALEELQKSGDPGLVPDALNGERLMLDLLSRMAAENPRGALEALAAVKVEAHPKSAVPYGSKAEKTAAEVRSSRFSLLLRAWAACDPAGAATFLTDFSSRTAGNYPKDQAYDELVAGTVREFAGDLVQRDPGLAVPWVQGLKNEGAQSIAAKEVLAKIAERDPVTARDLILSLPGLGPDRGWTAARLAGTWAKTQPQEAMAWAQSLPAEWNAQVVAGALSAAAYTNLSTAVTQYGSLTDPGQRDASLQTLGFAVRSLGNVGVNVADASRVFGLIEKEADGTGRWNAAKAVVETVAREDPVTASEWLARLPPGETRDSAISGFAWGAIADRRAPAEGMEWAAAMTTSPGRRMTLLKDSLGMWAHHDKTAATAWVQSTQRLTSDDRAVLLSTLPK